MPQAAACATQILADGPRVVNRSLRQSLLTADGPVATIVLVVHGSPPNQLLLEAEHVRTSTSLAAHG